MGYSLTIVDSVALGMTPHALQNIAGTIEDAGAAINISANGASFIGEPSEAVVERTMEETAGMGRACQFILGDLIAHAASRWGEKYARWMEVTGLDYGTLRNYVSVCRSIPMGRRRNSLSFSHHQEVAALPEDGQERWLDEAKERKMSKARLRKSIELGRPATQEDLKPNALPPASTTGGNDEPTTTGSTVAPAPEQSEPSPIETVIPHVNRLTAFLGKLSNTGALDEMNAEQLFSLHRDLLPVLSKHGAIINQIRRVGTEDQKREVMSDLSRALG